MKNVSADKIEECSKFSKHIGRSQKGTGDKWAHLA